MDRSQTELTSTPLLQSQVADDISILEGLLFAAGTEGLTERQIATVLRLGIDHVQGACARLADRQTREGRLFRVVKIADTWQLVTHPDLSPYLRELALAPAPTNLSTAALETLSIVAYKQPITRSQIEDIRGVKSEKPLGTLVARGLVEEVGRADGPGRPYLYGTTKEFLDHFGITSAGELPPLPASE